MNIEALAQWSGKPGDAQRQALIIRAAFWAAWRSDKEALRAAGVRVAPGAGKSWRVTWGIPAAAPQNPVDSYVPDTSRAWSPEQDAIFRWFHHGTGNLVVTARAGTGKTTTVSKAFSYAPENTMLYAVFNRKNKLEADAKISDSRVRVMTLHSLGYRLIKMIWPLAVPDDAVELDRVREVVGSNTKPDVVSAIARLVGYVKNDSISPSADEVTELAEQKEVFCEAFEYPDNGSWTLGRFVETAMAVLAASKVQDQRHRVSFSDMVWLPVAMGWCRPMFDLVVIDEAQDMSLPQLTMATKVCQRGGRVCVVGDDRQAIYLFRGARLGAMDWMRQTLNAAALGLTVTYRCPKSVVALASQFVPDYRAAASAPDGVVSEACEADMVAKVAVGDAVLSRLNAPLMEFCLKLLKRGIPARIEGRDVGKQLLALVHSFKARSIPEFIERVDRWAERMVSRALRSSEDQTKKIESIKDEAAALIAVAEGCDSVGAVEQRLTSMFSDTTGLSEPAVVCSSVHRAKGLEWNKVWVLASTFRVKGATQEVSEEANLFYVAITRAKQELVMVKE